MPAKVRPDHIDANGRKRILSVSSNQETKAVGKRIVVVRERFRVLLRDGLFAPIATVSQAKHLFAILRALGQFAAACVRSMCKSHRIALSSQERSSAGISARNFWAISASVQMTVNERVSKTETAGRGKTNVRRFPSDCGRPLRVLSDGSKRDKRSAPGP